MKMLIIIIYYNVLHYIIITRIIYLIYMLVIFRFNQTYTHLHNRTNILVLPKYT